MSEIDFTKCILTFLCNSTFHFFTVTSSHMENKSNKKENGGECDICKKYFRCKSSISRHKKIHMGSEIKENEGGECDICKKYFTCKYRIPQHKRDVHDEAIERPICSKCNKVFKIIY